MRVVAGIKKNLADAVRKLATKTSVDQLKKQGVKQVNVVGLDRIVAFVEEAVHRTLRDRLLVGERAAIADATREEFVRLLRSNEELRARQSRDAEEVNALRLDLQRLNQELAERIDAAHAEERPTWESEDERIAATVRAVVAAALREGRDAASLERRVLEVVMGLVGDERRTTLEAKAAARDNEVELLQRRIQKLAGSLEDAEHKIGELARTKDGGDGIASIYREAQGLAGGEDDFARKQSLMAEIFAANLKLQKGG